MEFLVAGFEIIEQEPGLEGMYKAAELPGRICYGSQDKMAPGTAEKFCNGLMRSQHCYDGETEILTEQGWIKFKKYTDEKVAVINQDCSFKGFETPSNVIRQEYTGTYYYYPSMGIEVTDGHNMVGVFRKSNNDFYNNNDYEFFKCGAPFVDANGKSKTLGERMFKTPMHCKKNTDNNPLGELIGFWLGDGVFAPDTPNKLCFHMRKERKINYLKDLCGKLGYDFAKLKSDRYTVSHDGIGKLFCNYFYNNGEKKIDINYSNDIVFNNSIIKGLINSDGTTYQHKKTLYFTNTSKSVIEWLGIYAPLCGYAISIKPIERDEPRKTLYKVYLLNTNYVLNNDSRKSSSKVIITNKTDNVYCVTVSTGLIMVRGVNGVTNICGNCAPLEHGTVYLKAPLDYGCVLGKYQNNKYSKFTSDIEYMYVTTNLRVLFENGWMDDLQYWCEPTEFHERRYQVRFLVDRFTGEEFLRHRVASFNRESTRYVLFTKEKFGGGSIKYIVPVWLLDRMDEINDKKDCPIEDFCQSVKDFECGLEPIDDITAWMFALKACEWSYCTLTNVFGWKAEQARTVLPCAINSPLIKTAFLSDWKHFFSLRAIGTTGKPHPQASELAVPLMNEFIERGYLEPSFIDR